MSYLLPVIDQNVPETGRACNICNDICIDENEPLWKSTCGDCYLSKILPTKTGVALPKYILEEMSIDKLGTLPMTWGKKYNGIQLKDIPLSYWEFLTLCPYFKPEKHLHIYVYLVKICNSIVL